MRKNDIHKWITLIAAVTTIFLLGVFIGWERSQTSSAELGALVKEAQFKTEGFLLEQQFIRNWMEDDCPAVHERLGALSGELSALGKTLDDSDVRPDVFRMLKLDYHLLQIRTYALMKEARDKCGSEVPVILYYFGKDDDDSGRQGEVLDRVAKDYRARIFAVEYGYADELSFVEDYYKVDETPSLIVEYDKVLSGYSDYGTITRALE